MGGCGCGGGEESGCLDHNDGRVWRRRGERLSGPQRWAGVEEERRAVVWTTTMGGCGGGEESGCLDHNDGRVWVWRRRGERLSGPQRWAGVGVEEERRAVVWTTTMGGCGGGEESGCLDHNDGLVWVWRRRGERLSGPQRWAGVGVEEERRAVVWTTTMGGCGGGEESGCLDHNDGRVWVWRRRGERLSGPQRWAGVGVEEERRAVVWTTTMGWCGCGGGEESGCLDHNDGRVWVWRRRGERLSGPQRWADVGVEEERRAVVWTTTMGGCGCGGGEESGCLDHNDGRMWVWRRRGERLQDECVKEMTPFGGGSVMVWAGFSAHHRTPLHHVQGNLNGQRYRDEILKPLVVPALQQIGQQAVLQDDNARPHRARVVNTFLQQAGVNRMDWPACSPDLNPIENLWGPLAAASFAEPSACADPAAAAGPAAVRVASDPSTSAPTPYKPNETSLCRMHCKSWWTYPLLTPFS